MTACVEFLRHVCCAQEAFLGMSLDINKVLSMATKLGKNLEGHEMYAAITRWTKGSFQKASILRVKTNCKIDGRTQEV